MPHATRVSETAAPIPTGLDPTGLVDYGPVTPATALARPAYDAAYPLARGAVDRQRLAHPSTLRRWSVGVALAGTATSLLLLHRPRVEPPPIVEPPSVSKPARVVRLAPIVLADFAPPVEPPVPQSTPTPTPTVPTPAVTDAAASKDEPAPVRRKSRRSARSVSRTRNTLPAPAASESVASSKAFRRHMRAGAAAFNRSRFKTALKHYSRAAQLDPNSADASFGVALAAVELYRDELGYQAVFRTLRLAPDHALGNLLAGYLMQTYGDVEGASASYARYLEIEPEGKFALEVRSLLKSLSRDG